MHNNSPLNVYMQADRQTLVAPKIDITRLLGSWLNTNPETQYLTKIVFRTENDRLWLHSYGSSDTEPIDWGEVETMPYIAGNSTQVSNFHATYCFEAAQVHCSGRVFSGMVEIMINTCYVDNSGRNNHFSREFFRQLIPHTPSSDFINFQPVLGHWINSKSDSQGIRQFTLRQSNQQLLFHPRGALASEDWAEVEVIPFLHANGDRAFLAEYQFDTHKLNIVANTNRGLWVLAAYHIYEHSPMEQPDSQPNFLRREFFCCADTPQS